MPHTIQPDTQYDLLGYSADDQLCLVVEVKGRTQEGAIRLAGDWLQQVGRQRPELFSLFVTPAFMLLRQPAAQRPVAPVFVDFAHIGTAHRVLAQQLLEQLPDQFDYAISSAACLDAAIDTQQILLDKLTAGGLERVVNSWLSFAALLPVAELQQLPTQAWLIESGLHEALANGKVTTAPAWPQTYGFAA